VPQAVAEHDAIVRLAVPVDVARRIAQQPGRVEQSPTASTLPLLRVLTPLTAEVDARSDHETCTCDRRFEI
jgi:hypothetical protein